MYSKLAQHIESFKRYPLLKDALTLATGSAVAQAMSFAASPILARLYTPEDFGVFSIYAFVTSLPSICWCYELAVLLPKEDDEGRHVVTLAIVIASVMTVLAVAPVLIGAPFMRLLNAPALAPWLGCLPINLFALGVYQAVSYWYSRVGDFGRLAVSRVIQSASTVGSQAAGGMLAAGAGGLIIGQVLGQVVASGFLWGSAVRRGELNAKAALHSSTLMQTLYRYRRFPLYSSWGTLMSVAAFQVVPVLLSRHFGPTEAGFYFFGYRLMSATVLLGASSIGQVLYQRAALALNEGRSIAPLVEAVVGKLFGLFIVPFGVFMAFAPEVFAFVFGPRWRTAGHYMSIATPLFFIQMLTSPVSMVLFLLEKQHIAAFIQLALLMGTLGSFTLGKMLEATVTDTLAIYALIQCIIYLAYLTIVLRLSSASLLNLLRAIGLGQARAKV